MFDIEDLSFFKLNENTLIKPFNCNDEKLRNFLLIKAKEFQKEYLGVTYVFENESSTIAYFTICTDSLKVQEEMFASKSAFKRVLESFVTHKKRYLEDFPAIKLGRLAVSEDYKGNGLGSDIIDYLINFIIELNDKVSCKLITVDAYLTSIEFYEKKDFKYLITKESDEHTRQMFLDVSPYINATKK